MSEPLSDDEQDALVMDLSAEGTIEPDDPEFDGLYQQLDPDRRAEVDESFRQYAINAVGHEHWDSDA